MRETRRPDSVFWVEPDAVRDDRLTLSRDESHHLLDVFRAQVGAAFEAVDGTGLTYACVLESAERGTAAGRVVEVIRDRGELSNPLVLILGLPDDGAAETVVAHAIPLGVSAIDFVVCERSGRPALASGRLERLGRIARSATKQSRRSRLPEIRSSASLGGALEIHEEGARFVADPAGEPLSPATHLTPQASITVAVGPPGGFTGGELERLDRGRFHRISLGPSRLTTETAAIAMLAVARNSLIVNRLDPI